MAYNHYMGLKRSLKSSNDDFFKRQFRILTVTETYLKKKHPGQKIRQDEVISQLLFMFDYITDPLLNDISTKKRLDILIEGMEKRS